MAEDLAAKAKAVATRADLEADTSDIKAAIAKLQEGLSEKELANVQKQFKAIGTARDWRRAVAQNAELLAKIGGLLT